jgi:hypothetical protein
MAKHLASRCPPLSVPREMVMMDMIFSSWCRGAIFHRHAKQSLNQYTKILT